MVGSQWTGHRYRTDQGGRGDGRGPDLGDDEWPHLLRTIRNTAGPKANILCGLKTKNTLHTMRMQRAQDLGANGLQIDLPIFHHPIR